MLPVRKRFTGTADERFKDYPGGCDDVLEEPPPRPAVAARKKKRGGSGPKHDGADSASQDVHRGSEPKRLQALGFIHGMGAIPAVEHGARLSQCAWVVLFDPDRLSTIVNGPCGHASGAQWRRGKDPGGGASPATRRASGSARGLGLLRAAPTRHRRAIDCGRPGLAPGGFSWRGRVPIPLRLLFVLGFPGERPFLAGHGVPR